MDLTFVTNNGSIYEVWMITQCRIGYSIGRYTKCGESVGENSRILDLVNLCAAAQRGLGIKMAHGFEIR